MISVTSKNAEHHVTFGTSDCEVIVSSDQPSGLVRHHSVNDNPSSLSVTISKMSEALDEQRKNVQEFQENCKLLKETMGTLGDGMKDYAEKLNKISTKRLRKKSLRLIEIMDTAIS